MCVYLNEEFVKMGIDPAKVIMSEETEHDQHFQMQMMKISRSSDFSEDELAYYQEESKFLEEKTSGYHRGRILTPDFEQDELEYYQWMAEHPSGSCRGFRLTEDPSEQEVSEWKESLDYLNNLDFAEAKSRIEFVEREEPDVSCSEEW